MKRLSEFTDDKAFSVVADLIGPIFSIVSNAENKPKDGENVLSMFQRFFKNNAAEMRQVFAILSETPVEDYHCTAVDVAKNLLTLAGDKELIGLFQSQEQTGDATSSVPVSGTTEAP